MSWHQVRAATVGAGITIVTLIGGLLLGFMLGSFVFDTLSGHTFSNPNPLYVAAAAVPALAGFIGGSALWGAGMGWLAHSREPKRMAVAGALGFAPIALGLAILLQILEPLAVDKLGALLPLHRLFTFFFVPTAFLIAGVSAFAIGICLRERALAQQLFWRVGVTAVIAFVFVNLVMEANGWVVGAPGAAERATMLTVLFAGNFAAAIAGGAVMGLMLARDKASAQTKWIPSDA